MESQLNLDEADGDRGWGDRALMSETARFDRHQRESGLFRGDWGLSLAPRPEGARGQGGGWTAVTREMQSRRPAVRADTALDKQGGGAGAGREPQAPTQPRPKGSPRALQGWGGLPSHCSPLTSRPSSLIEPRLRHL